jgi:adenylate kinase
MKYVVIFGPPGSGKGTQSERIIDKYGFAHISTGDVLRAEIANDTAYGKEADGYISKGQLVPDELIIDMLASTLDAIGTANGVVLDGFPRTTPQAEALQAMLQKRGGDVNVMLSLEVEKDALVERLLERGKSSGRSDDNLETIEKRIAVYNKQTTPVIDFYKETGAHRPIVGIGSIDEIFERIVTVMND